MKFRVKYKLFRGWEPQQHYNAGIPDGMFWFPLRADGFWLEPEAYSYANITKHNYFSLAEARRIVLKAKALCGLNINLVQPR